MNVDRYTTYAKRIGFTESKLIKVSDIIFNHSFRKYCEENLCGFYGKNYACPPYCGTPEEMEERVRKYTNIEGSLNYIYEHDRYCRTQENHEKNYVYTNKKYKKKAKIKPEENL